MCELTFITSGRFPHPVSSRSLLAFVGVCGIGLAIGAAYGVCALAGVKYTVTISVLPFIILGVGADSMFVLVSAADEESSDEPPSISFVMSNVMGRAGVSVVLAAFTDAVAFALGSTSSLPALSIFCTYAAVAISFDALLALTLFSAALVLDLRRQGQGRGDCAGACRCAPKSVICCGGKITIADQKAGLVRRFITNYYSPLLAKPVWNYAVVICALALAGFMLSQAIQLKQDFSLRLFTRADSFLQVGTGGVCSGVWRHLFGTADVVRVPIVELAVGTVSHDIVRLWDEHVVGDCD
jgi:predicted RND superfamily exporter protein